MNSLMPSRAKIIAAAPPFDYTGAPMVAYYVSLKNAEQITFIIQTGAWAAGTAAVTIMESIDVLGSGTPQALTFTAYWTGTAASGVLVETVCASTFDLDTANSLYVIPIHSATLTLADDYDCVTLAIGNAGGNDLYSVAYVLEGLRYAQATPPSVIVD